MARLYARYAWSAYNCQNWQELDNLIEKGMEFDADNPDLLSFRGILLYRERKFRAAGEAYSTAFKNSRDTLYISQRELLSRLGGIHYRLGEYQPLVDLFYAMDERLRDNSDFLYFTVLSLYELGRSQDAIALAEEGVYRYQDQRFLILLSGWLENSGYPVILNEFLDRQGSLYPDLMARTVIQSGKEDSTLSYQYVSRFHDYNSWYFSSEQLKLPGESLLFSPHENTSRVWPEVVIKKLWEVLSPEGGPTAMILPEILLLDQSGDGIEDWEIRSSEDEKFWTRDEDQDGAADFSIQWSGRHLPGMVEYFGKDSTLRCYYYVYPQVERIEIEGGDRNKREYLYLPGAYTLPLTENNEISWIEALGLGEDHLPLWLRSGESAHMKACYSLREFVTSPQSRLFREYTVISGTIRRFKEDSNFDGHFDRMVLLKDWVPYEGYRDLNLDGDFDLKELYRNGRLTGLEIQGDRSHIEEYYDLWNSKRYQLWNFDETSFYDAVLTQNSDMSWNEQRLNSNIIMQTD